MVRFVDTTKQKIMNNFILQLQHFSSFYLSYLSVLGNNKKWIVWNCSIEIAIRMSITKFLNIWFCSSFSNKKCECVLKTVHVMLHIKAAASPSQRTSHIQMANTVIHNGKYCSVLKIVLRKFSLQRKRTEKVLSKLNVPLSFACFLSYGQAYTGI